MERSALSELRSGHLISKRKRWIPLSLRLFAALLSILGIASALVGFRGYRQLAAIRKIEGLHGHVEVTPVRLSWLRSMVGEDYMRMFDEVTHVDFGFVPMTEEGSALRVHLRLDGYFMIPNPPLKDKGLGHLRGAAWIRRLALDGSEITDAGLAHLQELASLHSLGLDNTPVTDCGLAHLRGLTNLQVLSLANTPVTDVGLAHLSESTSLCALGLEDSHLTDAGLAHLQGLVNLQDLRLSNTAVSDVGLAQLRQLLKLRVLTLANTQVTDDGIAELKRALPSVRIYR